MSRIKRRQAQEQPPELDLEELAPPPQQDVVETQPSQQDVVEAPPESDSPAVGVPLVEVENFIREAIDHKFDDKEQNSFIDDLTGMKKLFFKVVFGGTKEQQSLKVRRAANLIVTYIIFDTLFSMFISMTEENFILYTLTPFALGAAWVAYGIWIDTNPGKANIMQRVFLYRTEYLALGLTDEDMREIDSKFESNPKDTNVVEEIEAKTKYMFVRAALRNTLKVMMLLFMSIFDLTLMLFMAYLWMRVAPDAPHNMIAMARANNVVENHRIPLKVSNLLGEKLLPTFTKMDDTVKRKVDNTVTLAQTNRTEPVEVEIEDMHNPFK